MDQLCWTGGGGGLGVAEGLAVRNTWAAESGSPIHRRSPEVLRGIELKLAAKAAAQLGLITLKQALAIGMSGSSAPRRVASGRWESLQRGVYAFAGTPKSRDRDILEACLAAGEQAVASHFTAAELWGIREVRPRDQVHLTVPREGHSRRKGVVTHRSGTLPKIDADPRRLAKKPSSERAMVRGIPVTSPMRTIVDLAGTMPFEKLELALMDLVRRRLVSPGEAIDASQRHRARAGAGKLRRILAGEAFLHFTRSALEDRAVQALVRNGFAGKLKTNEDFIYDGQFIGQADIVIHSLRLVIEMDGSAEHGTQFRRNRDAWRDEGYRAAGYLVLHQRWHDVDDPRAFAQRVAAEGRKKHPVPVPKSEFRQFWAAVCAKHSAAEAAAKR